MNTTAITTIEHNSLAAVIHLVTNSVTSAHSQRAYSRNLAAFLAWYDGQGRPGMTKATVNAYRAELLTQGLSSSSVNQALSAIRKLATEAADNGLLDPTSAAAIGRVKGVSQKGRRAGNWLTKEQAGRLINSPDIGTLKGLRDRAILAVMIGAGLRRSEVANLTFAHIQQREGRWVIIDLVGKGNRIRTVPIPAWCKHALDQWTEAAGLTLRQAQGKLFGRVFVSINKGGNVDGERMTPQAIYNLVSEYAAVCGLDVAAHDLRRTFAKLAHKGGAALEQIQLTLGHASIQTTERYLGVEQRLDVAPCDVLGLQLN